MRTVRDADGKRCLLLKQSAESSLVRDPQTGTERYVANDELEPIDGEPALVTAASGVDAPVRRLVTAVHSERALGLLVELVDRGPCPVVDVLDSYDLCESDLHGLLAEFRAAGLIEEAEVYGQRGYDATQSAVVAVERLRGEESDSRRGDESDSRRGDESDSRRSDESDPRRGEDVSDVD